MGREAITLSGWRLGGVTINTSKKYSKIQTGDGPGVRPFLSVLIPAYNEERTIGRAIGSVRAGMEEAGVSEFEVIVCDNNSADETGRLATEAGAKVVYEPHNQIARARNVAARAAAGEWLIFMDADSELPVGLLQETLRQIRGRTVGAGGALVRFERDDLGWHVKIGLGFWNVISRVMNWAAGSYIYCRREAWEETGGFNEEFYAAEELVFSRSLKRWCRRNGMRFLVIREPRLRTSSRKIDHYSPAQMVRLLLGLAWPGALKNRERCGYWYKRDR